jgi:fructokinase
MTARTQRALVIGEALIDIVERDGKVTGEHVGGSPLNVAVGLARLGRGVDFLTHIGDDAAVAASPTTSKLWRATGFGQQTGGRTPTALATLDASGSAQYVFDIDWQLPGHRRWRRRWSRTRVDRDGARTGLPCAARAARRLSPLGDDHVRPERAAALIEDDDMARSRIDRWSRRCDVVKASDEDMRWIDPNRTPEQIARRGWARARRSSR